MADKTKLPKSKSPAKRKPLNLDAKSPKKAASKTKAKSTKAPTARDPKLSIQPNELTLDQRKFVLDQPLPAPEPQPPAYEYLGELPEAYGTKRLYLIARDPHWLFAYWDLTWQQYQDAARSAHDGKVFLQLYGADGGRQQQIQINEGSKNWYLHVGEAGAAYFSELGYYRQDGGFEVISRSAHTNTPPDSLSWKTDAKFVTIPFDFSFRDLLALIGGEMQDGEDLADALARLQEEGFDLPFKPGKRGTLGEEEHGELLDYLAGDFKKRLWVGSMEITEELRERFRSLVSSGEWMGGSEMSSRMTESGLGMMGSESVSSLSSPFGAEFGREFFMHVNAELIIYGGTDPKAKVRVDGQDIRLREDGTFSYHFILPDGKFFIPIEATSPDGVENRSAMLSFMRLTDKVGKVDDTGQPPLNEPLGRTE